MAAADVGPVSSPRADLRSLWLTGTVVLTVGSFAAAIVLAPEADASPSTALIWLLFVGSSVHVGATAWFYAVPEVRSFMWTHPVRYLGAPALLIVGSALASVLISLPVRTWWLLVFFAWQFFHFQKQNLGMAALAARSTGIPPLTRPERVALQAAGIGGIAALVGHPELLQIGRPLQLSAAIYSGIFGGGIGVFAVAIVIGCVALVRRRRPDRSVAFGIVYAISLAFFLPVFLFSSPYAAVAGLTIAHGMQYLLIMSLVAGNRSSVAPARVKLLLFLNLAVLLGLGLNQAAHMDTRETLVGRAIFGVFLGVSMSHFVIDAGLWRLRDVFPRQFLSDRLPYLLDRSTP